MSQTAERVDCRQRCALNVGACRPVRSAVVNGAWQWRQPMA
jgi:hypothetical protein